MSFDASLLECNVGCVTDCVRLHTSSFPSIHNTMRSVCRFHSSAASTKKSRHWSYEARVSVRLIRRGESSAIGGTAMMPPTASQKWPAMVSRWLRLVRLYFISATAACGRHKSACRPTRSTSCSMRARPLSPVPSGAFRLFSRPSTRGLCWSEEKLCTTCDAATSLALL